jgi:hypothetical protein
VQFEFHGWGIILSKRAVFHRGINCAGRPTCLKNPAIGNYPNLANSATDLSNATVIKSLACAKRRKEKPAFRASFQDRMKRRMECFYLV